LFVIFGSVCQERVVSVFLYIDICICPSPAIHVESPPHLKFSIKSGILHNTTDAMWYWGHHVSDMVYESPDKDGFSKTIILWF
jgi:hypothetical protein